MRAVRWSEIAVVFQSALNALNPVLRIGKLLDDVLKTHAKTLTRPSGGPGPRSCSASSGSAPTG